MCRKVSGGVGWPVTTPYGKGSLLKCNYDSNTYTVDLQWGICYNLKADDCVCWEARCLPATIFVMKGLHFALEKFRENLKSFSKIFNKFTSGGPDSNRSLEVIEDSMSSVMKIFQGGDIRETFKLTLEMQRSNMINSLTYAQDRLVGMLRDIDVKELHDTSRSTLEKIVSENGDNSNFYSQASAQASKAIYEELRSKIDSTMKTLYDVDLVAAVDQNVAKSSLATGTQDESTNKEHATILDLVRSVNELVEMTTQTTKQVADSAQKDLSSNVDMTVLNDLHVSINSSYASLMNEMNSAQKLMSQAVMESKSGSKLLSGGLKLKDRVVGMLNSSSPQPRSPAPGTGADYSAVFSAINKKLTRGTSVKALSNLRDKLVQTATTSSYTQQLMQSVSNSASIRVNDMLTEWYDRVFSSAQDNGISLLAGKQLFDAFLSAYTQVRLCGRISHKLE
jgi:hypothetical protein